MAASGVWASKRGEVGFLLQRRFWKPLRNMMDIFHVLPLAAVLILFVLLATDGQFREIYIAYLEGPQDSVFAWVAGIVTAIAALGLISAVLYEAHYALSTMRVNVVYSSYSNPDANSKMRRLQRAAAFVLAFLPWLGLTLGLFGARISVANRYCQLLEVAGVAKDELHRMQYLALPGGWTIAGAVLILGAAAAYLSSAEEQNRTTQRAVACCAPALAVLLFLLFSDWLDTNKWSSRTTAICSAVIAVTVIYYSIYRWLCRRRSRFVLFRAQTGTGVSLRKRRRRWLAVWAFLPWFFLAGYFACIQRIAPMAQFAEQWADCPLTAASVPVPGHWAIFPVAMCGTIAFGLVLGHVLGRFSASRRRLVTVCILVAALAAAVEGLSFFGTMSLAVSVYRLIGPLGTAFLELLFLISTFAGLAALSQRSGFPALTLVLLTVVVCVMFPNYAGLTASVLAALYAVFAIVGFLSRQYAVGIVGLLLPLIVWVNWHPLHSEPKIAQNPAIAGNDLLAVQARFQCWLAFRGVTTAGADHQALDCSMYGVPPPGTAGTGKYPVFIIAAEGGGIYAASAAATMLAILQDAVPEFSEHVFAISGVSGGAIGAAIFRALDHPTQPKTSADVAEAGETCVHYPAVDSEPARPSSAEEAATFLQDEVATIMRGDHFSPVVGSIFPEIFGAPLTRAQALVASFDYSASALDADARKELCAAFDKTWSPSGGVPALVLNSTWVETGFRVAFAPFNLHSTDESLYSFSDADMPSEQATTNLMEAAAVSARFPLIMPPFSVVMQNPDKLKPKKMDTKRWNFVDGAYSDNSGASTAIDIYRAIQKTPNVDLHIILVTSTNLAPNLKDDSINGTVFRDTIAPLDALMKVRADLGDEAVARACTYVYLAPAEGRNRRGVATMEANDFCLNQADKDGAALQIVEIQDQTYGLALGWKISATTFAVVKWMLGRPDRCADRTAPSSSPDNKSAIGTGNSPKSVSPAAQNASADQIAPTAALPVATADDPNAQLTKDILLRNSCVLASIAKLVKGWQAAASSDKAGQ